MIDRFFLALLETTSLHSSKSREAFQKINLTDGQPKILYILFYNNGVVQKKLAQLCRIKQSTLTVMLDKLEKRNYIYKEKVIISGGKRAYSVFLTEEGMIITKEIREFIDELEEQSMKGFTIEEKEKLMSLLSRVCDNLK